MRIGFRSLEESNTAFAFISSFSRSLLLLCAFLDPSLEVTLFLVQIFTIVDLYRVINVLSTYLPKSSFIRKYALLGEVRRHKEDTTFFQIHCAFLWNKPKKNKLRFTMGLTIGHSFVICNYVILNKNFNTDFLKSFSIK